MAFDAGAIVGKVQLDSGELSSTVEKVNADVSSIGTTATAADVKVDKANQGMIKGFRSQIQPINMLRRTIFMVGSIWTATAGVAITAVLNLDKSYEKLYLTSGALGISVSDLSKKIYGFDIATIQARTGASLMNNLIQTAKDLWTKLGFAIAKVTNDYAVYQQRIAMDASKKSWIENLVDGLKRLTPGLQLLPETIKTTTEEAQAALTKNIQAQRANTIEAYSLQSDLTSKISALKGDEYTATKMSLDAQKAYYISTYGAGSDIVKTYEEFSSLTIEKLAARGDFFGGIKAGINQNIIDLSNWGQTGIDIANQMASSMRSSFSNLFQGLFKGNIDSFSEFMTSIGDLFLKTISDMIAQMVVLFFWQKLTGLLFSGSSTITGGVGGTTTQTAQFGTVWSPSFAEGTDSIPYTGTYRLHEGEKVTPKYDATKGDAIELTIVNQITPEAVATAMSGKEGQGVIVNTINTDALRNGTTRKTIRRK